jgi:hypothetical protein
VQHLQSNPRVMQQLQVRPKLIGQTLQDRFGNLGLRGGKCQGPPNAEFCVGDPAPRIAAREWTSSKGVPAPEKCGRTIKPVGPAGAPARIRS